MAIALKALEAQSMHSRARELDVELRSCVRQQLALDARIAVLLAELQQGKLWRQLNCTSLTDYGRKFLGYSSSKTSDLLQIGQRDDLPELLAAMEEGALGYKAALEVARVATPDDVEEWIQEAKDLRLPELRAKARGDELKERVVLDFPSEQFRTFDSGIEFVRKGSELWDRTEIVAFVFEDFLQRHTSGAESASEERGAAEAKAPRNERFRIHLDVCAECGSASQPTSRGPVEVSSAELERRACDVEVLDLREGPEARVTRTIPNRVRDLVWGRDRGTCQVPGCDLRGGVEIHHLDLWWRGHDPERMLVLCDEHHEQVHLGLLQIDSEESGARRFASTDGVALGNAGDRERTPPAGQPDLPPGGQPELPLGGQSDLPLGGQPDLPLGGQPEVVELAVAALRKLEMKSREARRWVERALASEGARPWAVGEWVSAALRLKPGRAA